MRLFEAGSLSAEHCGQRKDASSACDDRPFCPRCIGCRPTSYTVELTRCTVRPTSSNRGTWNCVNLRGFLPGEFRCRTDKVLARADKQRHAFDKLDFPRNRMARLPDKPGVRPSVTVESEMKAPNQSTAVRIPCRQVLAELPMRVGKAILAITARAGSRDDSGVDRYTPG